VKSEQENNRQRRSCQGEGLNLPLTEVEPVIPYMVSKGDGVFRTVIDTNIVFSGLYSSAGASHQVLRAIMKKQIQPVMSVALLFEYEDILKRNSRTLCLKYAKIDAILDAICALCSLHKIHYLWRPFLSDPNDDHVLELAVASGVKTITTFNQSDFAGVEKFGISLLSPKKLLEEIKWVL
jgi:putative PIN family toxin of toxin-antitoxin system